MFVTGKKSEGAQNAKDASQPTQDFTPGAGTDSKTAAEPATRTPPDDRVKVRVLKVAEKDAAAAPPGGESGQNQNPAATATPPSSSSQKQLKIPDEKKAQLESKVKDTLQKSGLDTEGKNNAYSFLTLLIYMKRHLQSRFYFTVSDLLLNF